MRAFNFRASYFSMKIGKSKVLTLDTAGLFLFGTMSRASSLRLFSCNKECFFNIRKHNNLKSQTKCPYRLDRKRGNNNLAKEAPFSF